VLAVGLIIAVLGLVGCNGLDAKVATPVTADFDEIDATWMLLSGSLDGRPILRRLGDRLRERRGSAKG
jgi:hypothetical protein